mmetsp:Transcript_10083/g.10032  ORF Transcript_10083/g.10032 Transcript_10083/m.10032 type:complete len:145 (-) Transcript_10083:46-480(-)
MESGQLSNVEPKVSALEERAEVQSRIANSISEFKSTLESMKQRRNESQEEKQRKLEEKKKQKRTQKLFSTKIDGLKKKKDFLGTVASQEIFSKTTFLEHGPLFTAHEKDMITSPVKIFEKGHKWVPTDDRHVYFETTLRAKEGK